MCTPVFVDRAVQDGWMRDELARNPEWDESERIECRLRHGDLLTHDEMTHHMERVPVTDDPERTGYLPEGEGPLGNEWISAIRSELAECLALAGRMLETTGRMADDMSAIRRCVMGDD